MSEKASPMEVADLQDLKLSCQIGQIMAQIHSLDMSFIKQPNWLFDSTAKYKYNPLKYVYRLNTSIKFI